MSLIIIVMIMIMLMVMSGDGEKFIQNPTDTNTLYKYIYGKVGSGENVLTAVAGVEQQISWQKFNASYLFTGNMCKSFAKKRKTNIC